MPRFSLFGKTGITMPTETIVVLTGIAMAFAIFAITLAWAERQTRKIGQPGPAE